MRRQLSQFSPVIPIFFVRATETTLASPAPGSVCRVQTGANATD